MRIQKAINNNIVWSTDASGKEVIVLGNGVGFKKSKGDSVDQARIEKVFYLSNDKMSQFEQLVKSIPLSSIKAAEKIIDYAKKQINIELNDNIYIALTDHLNYAIERKKQGIQFKNALLWEIKKYYPKEFSIGEEAVRIIEDDLNVKLSEDESGFFALHVVNAELPGDTSQGMDMPDIINDIVNLVKFTIKKDIKESSLSYERFITHLKFFLQRVIAHQLYRAEDLPWAGELKEEYALAYKTALRIQSYVKAKLKYNISEEEITYLTIHIQRIIERD